MVEFINFVDFRRRYKDIIDNSIKYYWIISDRYNYIELFDTCNECQKIVREITSSMSVNYMNPIDIHIHKTESYLTHTDRIYDLKSMKYIKICM